MIYLKINDELISELGISKEEFKLTGVLIFSIIFYKAYLNHKY